MFLAKAQHARPEAERLMCRRGVGLGVPYHPDKFADEYEIENGTTWSRSSQRPS